MTFKTSFPDKTRALVGIQRVDVKATNYHDDLRKRIAECVATRRSNCVGTALYLAGEQLEDRINKAIDSRQAVGVFEQLTPIDEPILGCLVIWKSTNKLFPTVEHAGIVTATTPLLITNRESRWGPLIVDQPFLEINAAYPKHDVEFYLPKQLQREIAVKNKVLRHFERMEGPDEDFPVPEF